MNYNLYISTKINTQSLLDIIEETVKKIVNAYKENKKYIFLEGEKFYCGNLREIQIYEFGSSNFQSGKQLYEHCKTNNALTHQYFDEPYISKNLLEKIGRKVTEIFIKDEELELIDVQNKNEDYVDVKRIIQLEGIKSNKYDFSRLIAILKEINVCYKNDLKFAIPPLIRSIIDQVPPIFSKANFSDICGSHGSKSFKEIITILDKNSRKIADSYLHTQIRVKESASPTETQINFKSELDILLEEIIRIS